MKKAQFALLPLTVFVALNVQAADTEQLDTIDVVSDNFSPQKENVNSKGVVKVRQATKMSDVLRGVPGVNVNGARSIVERYNIRGVSEEYLNITVDGARQEGYSFHHSGNYGIDPEILKRVDIDVGSNSVATGAGSLGGAIKFETVDAADMLDEGENFGGKLKYGWGSNGNSHQSMATLYGRASDLELLGYFNYRHHLNGEDGNGKENKDKGHLQNYLVKAKYNITPEQWVKFSAERYNNSALTCFKANFACDETSQDSVAGILRKTYTAAYGFKPKTNALIDLKANVYSTETDNTSMSSPKSNVKTIGGSLTNRSQFELGITDHNVLVGGEYYQTEALRYGGREIDRKTKKFKGIRPDYKQKSYSTSVYLEDAITLGDFIITPGIRFDHYEADLLDASKTYHKYSKALGLKYLPTENLVVFANYTELFKGPGFGELTLVAPGRYNAGFEPITGKNKEVGFSYSQDKLFSDNDGISLTTKYFRTDYKNIYQSIPGSHSGSTYENIGDVKLDGVEAQARYWLDNLSANVTYARARSVQKRNTYTAFPDAGDRYVFGLNYALPDLGVSMGWDTMLVRGLIIQTTAETKSVTAKKQYSVSNAYVTWSPKQLNGLELTAGVDNIFNKAYKDHSTKYYGAVDYEPGRNYKLSASYKF